MMAQAQTQTQTQTQTVYAAQGRAGLAACVFIDFTRQLLCLPPESSR